MQFLLLRGFSPSAKTKQAAGLRQTPRGVIFWTWESTDCVSTMAEWWSMHTCEIYSPFATIICLNLHALHCMSRTGDGRKQRSARESCQKMKTIMSDNGSYCNQYRNHGETGKVLLFVCFWELGFVVVFLFVCFRFVLKYSSKTSRLLSSWTTKMSSELRTRAGERLHDIWKQNISGHCSTHKGTFQTLLVLKMHCN